MSSIESFEKSSGGGPSAITRGRGEGVRKRESPSFKRGGIREEIMSRDLLIYLHYYFTLSCDDHVIPLGGIKDG